MSSTSHPADPEVDAQAAYDLATAVLSGAHLDAHAAGIDLIDHAERLVEHLSRAHVRTRPRTVVEVCDRYTVDEARRRLADPLPPKSDTATAHVAQKHARLVQALARAAIRAETHP
ncbi:hypothetical protein JGS22_015255 [Streptomyces sp. P38-E01]|uniref:Uncharacterized protein n=1 Tax=Streptomyces tardus TaxID=2780544 RepID=A0A949JGB9_9ACTN|nr:hypothetical protein [Streptomyces tardus]MBU7598932.1 hypothetical protein [Streptomyces tardus]